jgi:hypothetical protein
MTAAAAAMTDSLGRTYARMFVLTGASLPEGTQWIVGDVTYTDRKPGILAILYEDAGGSITASAGVNVSTETTSATWTLSGTTGSNERCVLWALSSNTLTPTAPTAASSAGNNTYERDGAASSTTMNLTQSLAHVWGTAIVLTGSGGGGATVAYYPLETTIYV